ncbi:MAG: murein biosynthesis integral membrane protein MurJ [Actinomycetota bacterium]|nr:murein biosynthesis integral membrane protein MurJ [Actinomycetota bacterium]
MGAKVRAAAAIVSTPENPEDTGQFTIARPAQQYEDTPRAFVRHSMVMATGTFLSRVTGFLRLAALTYALGVAESRLADAYNVANTTPNIVYELAFGGIISSVFVPVFVQRLHTDGREGAWRSASALLTVVVLVLTAVTIVGIVFSGPIIRLYTFRAEGPEVEAQRQLASFLLKWFFPQIIFYGLGAGVWTGLLNAHRRFAAPMFAPIANNLIATATFFTFAALPGGDTADTLSDAQRYVLAIGTTLGVVVMSMLLWPSLRRMGFRWRWTLDWRDPALGKIARLSVWSVLYVVVNQLGLLVIIILAQSVQGGVTAYQAAFIFFQLPYAIFAVSIMTALVPSLSQNWTEGDVAPFRDQLLQGIRATAFIIVPAALGYIALARPIVRLLLEHGVTQEASTNLIAGVLTMFSLGLFSFCSFQLMLRAFYSMQDTRTPALINVASVAFHTALNLVLFRYLKVEGLALGHAAAYTTGTAIFAVVIGRRLRGLEVRRLLRPLGQVLLAAVVAAIAAFAVSRWIGSVYPVTVVTPSGDIANPLLPQLVQVAAAVAVGIATYVALAAAFRMRELTLLKDVLLRRLRG